MGVQFSIVAGNPPILRVEGDASNLRKVAALLEHAADQGGVSETIYRDGEASGELRILRLNEPEPDKDNGLGKAGCPKCGEATGIFSVYRDGGSTLYHPSCKVDPRHHWPNPDFAFKQNPPGARR